MDDEAFWNHSARAIFLLYRERQWGQRRTAAPGKGRRTERREDRSHVRLSRLPHP